MTTFQIAQFSDSHLFSDINGLHYGANVYQNLCLVLNDIANNAELDIAIFTGDLTQDHSEESYQLFVKAVVQSQLAIPLYFLAGNHDDITLMERILTKKTLAERIQTSTKTHEICISNEKLITTEYWQIALLNSKSDTPAGIVDEVSLNKITELAENPKHTLLCMHHHPVDVGFGIDTHGLMNKTEFWQHVENNQQVKGVVCGHVHNAYQLEKTFGVTLKNTTKSDVKSINNSQLLNRNVILYTCPATSVEFNAEHEPVKKMESSPITNQGAGYQILSLAENGSIHRTVKYFPANFIKRDTN